MCLKIETDKKLVAYEQAVKAYQFQVTRYNTWMNYYALFVGALFVAFYMIICYSKSCSCASCYTCCSCGYQLPSTRFMLIFIAVLGIAASVCWMASLIGNCAWMNNYIKIVKENEKIFFGEKDENDENLIVYRRLNMGTREHDNRSNTNAETRHRATRRSRCECWECIKSIIRTWRRGFISTQKMTQWFVGAVLAAWIYIFIYLMWGNITIWHCGNITISIIAAFAIWLIFKCIPLPLWSDNLKGMTED